MNMTTDTKAPSDKAIEAATLAVYSHANVITQEFAKELAVGALTAALPHLSAPAGSGLSEERERCAMQLLGLYECCERCDHWNTKDCPQYNVTISGAGHCAGWKCKKCGLERTNDGLAPSHCICWVQTG